MNMATDVLHQQRADEDAALATVGKARHAADRAREKRAAVLAQLDAAVADAERAEDAAVARLVTLMGPDRVAGLLDLSGGRVRLAVQRAAAGGPAVPGLVPGDGAVVRRRGRPRGSDARSARGAPLVLTV